MVFHRSVSNCKSFQVSRTLLSILAVLRNAVVWMVSIHPPILNSTSPLSKSLRIVSTMPITAVITLTHIFHSFLSFLTRSKNTIDLEIKSKKLTSIFFRGYAENCHLFLTIIVIIIYSLEFFISALADGRSLEFEWQQVSSILQDSSQYSERSL